METTRQRKIARLLQRELSGILQSKLDFLRGVLITVSDVWVSADVSVCRVYLSCLPDSRAAEVLESVNQLRPAIRQELARRVRNELRIIPDVQFFEDEIPREVARLDAVFKNIHQKPTQNNPFEVEDL